MTGKERARSRRVSAGSTLLPAPRAGAGRGERGAGGGRGADGCPHQHSRRAMGCGFQQKQPILGHCPVTKTSPPHPAGQRRRGRGTAEHRGSLAHPWRTASPSPARRGSALWGPAPGEKGLCSRCPGVCRGLESAPPRPASASLHLPLFPISISLPNELPPPKTV